MIKSRPEKLRHSANVRTVDETHKKFALNFSKQKQNLPKKKLKLERLINQLAKLEQNYNDFTNEKINLRSQLKSRIRKLKEEINDIENDASEIEYYGATSELLVDYYRILEEGCCNKEQNDEQFSDELNIEHKHIKERGIKEKELSDLDIISRMKDNKKITKKITKRRRNRNIINPQNTITNYFQLDIIESNKKANKNNSLEEKDENDDKACGEEDNKMGGSTDTSDGNKENNYGKSNRRTRAAILDDFLSLVDKEYVSSNKDTAEISTKCSSCTEDMILILSDGMYVCTECGDAELVVVESGIPSYKDHVPEKAGYPYKRINHFNEL